MTPGRANGVARDCVAALIWPVRFAIIFIVSVAVMLVGCTTRPPWYGIARREAARVLVERDKYLQSLGYTSAVTFDPQKLSPQARNVGFMSAHVVENWVYFKTVDDGISLEFVLVGIPDDSVRKSLADLGQVLERTAEKDIWKIRPVPSKKGVSPESAVSAKPFSRVKNRSGAPTNRPA